MYMTTDFMPTLSQLSVHICGGIGDMIIHGDTDRILIGHGPIQVGISAIGEADGVLRITIIHIGMDSRRIMHMVV